MSSISYGASDALLALENSQVDLKVSIKSGDIQIKNLFISTTLLRNDGRAPILVADYYKNLSLNTIPPWQIIAVNNPVVGPQGISLNWQKISDVQFMADPALINPGDSVLATVYLTHGDSKAEPETPPLSWSARIANLPEIKIKQIDVIKFDKMPNVLIQIFGYGVFIVIILFVLYFSSYILLMKSIKLLYSGVNGVISLVLAAIVSISAAESSNTYISGATIFQTPINHWMNMPFIIINFLCILTLIVFSYKNNRP